MNLKKVLLSTAAALVIAPAASFAADFPVTVSVEAIIPAADGLQITPVGGWDAITQTMGWDIARQDLRPISQQIDMRSNAAIEGYLTNDAALTSGANLLPMAVRVNGKTLATGAAGKVEILTAAEAAASQRVAVEIATTKPGNGYVEGNYAGQVYMMFESTP